MEDGYFCSECADPGVPARPSPADESFSILKGVLEEASLDPGVANEDDDDLTVRFFLCDIRRVGRDTAKVVLYFHKTPEMLAPFLSREQQPLAILYSLTRPDGKAHNLEMPSLEIHEFVSTGGVNAETVSGEDDEGNLVVDSREEL